MVIDTSAIIALLKQEPDAHRFRNAISSAGTCFMSAVSVFEASLVMIGVGQPAVADRLDEFLHELRVVVVPFDEDMAALARDAFVRFGKGRHPAALNMGDCASYALAKALGLPLLFKGNDFPRTDILPVIL